MLRIGCTGGTPVPNFPTCVDRLLLAGDGFKVDGVVARSAAAFPYCLHEAAEDCLGKFIFIVAAFGMPLNAEDPVIGSDGLDGLDDPVVGLRDNLQSVADFVHGLVMARVHPAMELAVREFAPEPP